MSAHLSKLVSKAAKALSKQAGGPSVVGVMSTLPDGKRGLHWAIDEAAADDAEMIVIGILHNVEQRAAAGALECDGCAHRMARARAALAALRDSEGARPPHAHGVN